jgi:hypothetical protein
LKPVRLAPTAQQCFDAATGAKIWSVPTGGKAQQYQASSPAVYGDTILFGSLDGNLKAVRAIDGAPVWQYSTGGTIYSSPHLGLESAAPGAKMLACIGTDAGGLHVVEVLHCFQPHELISLHSFTLYNYCYIFFVLSHCLALHVLSC